MPPVNGSLVVRMTSSVPNGERGAGNPVPMPRLLGGRLCLDFANTVEDRTTGRPNDFLPDYAPLAHWGRHVGELTEGQLARLLEEGARRPDEAAVVFGHAIALREAIYRVFAAIAHGHSPPPADVAAIEAAYREATAHARLVRSGDGFAWAWAETKPGAALDRVLWPVARSAVALLTEPELARVKQCPGCDDCAWLFLDTSKNGTRRWCSMEGCGSRAKMRRQYARRKGVVA
jgi:predicted RNA-binding Zn ribbon-like protein